MDAEKIKLIELFKDSNTCFIVPNYKPAYNWSTIQCSKLFKDLLELGKGESNEQSFGSIILLESSNADEAEVQILDGQQRLTTIMLLLVALAGYIKENPHKESPLSFEELINGGYIFKHERENKSEYHLKLMLTEEDQATYDSVIQQLIKPNTNIIDNSKNIIENIEFFKHKIESSTEIDALWKGLHQLEVFTFSLVPGEDKPGLIYESMMFEYYK